MKRWIAAPALAAALVGAVSYAAAQDRTPRDMGRDMDGRGGRGMMSRFTPEDMEAFTDARLAALHAGLRLSADQEKLWPPVEEALRGLVKQRRDAMREGRESRGQGNEDIPATIRGMADRQAARADALRKVADTTAPLYATLDEGQKRRLGVLMRSLRPRGMMAARHHEGGMRHGHHGRDGRDR